MHYNTYMVTIGNSWDEILKDVFEGELYQNIRRFLRQEYSTRRIYPSMYDIFNAFKMTPYEEVKAVILGQDPYHEEGQAHGLCFSVPEGVPHPPSLRNIFKCIHKNLGLSAPRSGDLTNWAKQGVLLLNTTLTVRAGSANSHSMCGWQELTDEVIRRLNAREQPIVFMLWGSNARAKKQYVTSSKHLVLEACHPSPLSADRGGFFDCAHFSRANDFLAANSIPPINWSLC